MFQNGNGAQTRNFPKWNEFRIRREVSHVSFLSHLRQMPISRQRGLSPIPFRAGIFGSE